MNIGIIDVHVPDNRFKRVDNGSYVKNRIAHKSAVRNVQVVNALRSLPHDRLKKGLLRIQAVNGMPAPVEFSPKRTLDIAPVPAFGAQLGRIRAEHDIVFQIGAYIHV